MSWSGPEPAAEALWEQELARLCASRVPLRALPYAMVDKRLIRRLREPQGVKTSRWRQWQRRRRRAARRLGEAARRLSRGLGLWEGALYEIGGRTRATPAPRPWPPRREGKLRRAPP